MLEDLRGGDLVLVPSPPSTSTITDSRPLYTTAAVSEAGREGAVPEAEEGAALRDAGAARDGADGGGVEVVVEGLETEAVARTARIAMLEEAVARFELEREDLERDVRALQREYADAATAKDELEAEREELESRLGTM